MSAKTKPPALRPGDTVGIIAPASNIKREALEAGCRALERIGYRPFYFDSILEQDLYFAGSVERRTQELHEMFRRPEVRAIVCARGGYGANYLLPQIDIDVVRQNPKIFCGYSDVTCLLTYFCDAAGLVTFHAPMVAKDFTHEDGIDHPSWAAALAAAQPWSISEDGGMTGVRDGEAEGILYGGCLSILAASLGTPYEITTGGTILFVEDIAAKPYQIDRMLMQLKLAGKFREAHGIIFGQMLDCIQPGGQRYSLQEIVMRVLADLDVPIAFGLRSGHVTNRNITLPIGARARLTILSGSASVDIEPSVEAQTGN